MTSRLSSRSVSKIWSLAAGWSSMIARSCWSATTAASVGRTSRSGPRECAKGKLVWVETQRYPGSTGDIWWRQGSSTLSSRSAYFQVRPTSDGRAHTGLNIKAEVVLYDGLTTCSQLRKSVARRSKAPRIRRLANDEPLPRYPRSFLQADASYWNAATCGR